MYEQFLNALKALGGRATNKQMLEALGWNKVDYIHTKEALKIMKQVKSVRCRGGAVALFEWGTNAEAN